jgi:elongation factor G
VILHFRLPIQSIDYEADEEKMGEYLHRLAGEDPTYLIEYSKELKQILVHGQGEYHINTLKWHFDNVFKIDIQFLNPKIPVIILPMFMKL